jgi:hypothetical protein
MIREMNALANHEILWRPNPRRTAKNFSKKFRAAQLCVRPGGGWDTYNAGGNCSDIIGFFLAGTTFGCSYVGAPSSSCPRPSDEGGFADRFPHRRAVVMRPNTRPRSAASARRWPRAQDALELCSESIEGSMLPMRSARAEMYARALCLTMRVVVAARRCPISAIVLDQRSLWSYMLSNERSLYCVERI